MAMYYHRPVKVPRIETKYRRIVTSLPVPESIPILKKLEKYEPQSMRGQLPVIWDRAEGFQVFDKYGNIWLDWSSGVLITNVGHAHPAICQALEEQLQQKLLATYVFYHEKRAQLVELLCSIAPEGLDKVFLVSTGSEAIENSIKLARTYGVSKGGKRKHIIISFANAFHGRTMGAQLAGGNDRLKEWIVNQDPGFISVPFPDGYYNENISFDLFLKTIREKKINPNQIAGVITESYQGVGPFFLPVEYAQNLSAFCKRNGILLIMDEIQSGFGRTGKWFAFEHYGIIPDLIACGKGISSSLPLAAVIGRAEVMDLYQPGSMTSTHSGSPLPVAASLANLKVMKKEKILDHVLKMEPVLLHSLKGIQQKHPLQIGSVTGKGLVAGIQMVQIGSKQPDPKIALRIIEKCFQKGLLLFAPVGTAGQCIKICPPLITSVDALNEGIAVFEEVCDELLG
jgi:4-aminobutyrate aminotransferase/(S)-3-amino-2-methylpropionate transaminase